MEYTLTAEELAIGALLTKVLPPAYAGKVLSEDQRGSGNETPYATFKFYADVERMATPVSCLTDAPGTDDPTKFVERSAILREATCSVQVFGPTAYQDLRDAVLKIRRPDIVEETKASGVTVRITDTIRRVPVLALQSRQNRAQIDLRVFYVQTTTHESDAVERTCGTVAGDDLDQTF